MAYVQNVRVRFEDVDYARIVFFPRLFNYCHWVFEDFFAQEAKVTYDEIITKRRVGFPTVRAEADFKAPLRFGDICRVAMETRSLGRRSITNGYRLYLGDSDKMCAELEIVTVSVDMTSFEAVELPEDIRSAFLRHLVNIPSGRGSG